MLNFISGSGLLSPAGFSWLDLSQEANGQKDSVSRGRGAFEPVAAKVSAGSRKPTLRFLRRRRRRKLPFSKRSSMDSQPEANVQKFPFPFSLPSVRGTCAGHYNEVQQICVTVSKSKANSNKFLLLCSTQTALLWTKNPFVIKY